MAEIRRTAEEEEEEEEEGEGGGAAEATIICPAVLIRPIREGSMEAAGAGILITAAKRASRRADRRLHHIIKEEGMEVSRVEGACCRRVVVEGSTPVSGIIILTTEVKTS